MYQYIDAIVLGVLNHVFFHKFEPVGFPVVLSILALAVEPLLLALYWGKDSSLMNILITYVLFYTSLSTSIALYRLSPFHPLAKIPGPWMAKISKLWLLWVRWQGHHYITFKELHDRYGPFIRIGPNDLSAIDVKSVTAILGAGGLEKGQWYRARQEAGATIHTLILLRKEAHRDRRRLWNRGLNQDSLHEYDLVFAEKVPRFVAKLEQICKTDIGPFDFVKWLQFYSFDFMSTMAFGREYGMLDAGKDEADIWGLIHDFAVATSVMSNIPWADYIFQRIPLRGWQLRRVAANLAKSRLSRNPEFKDLWYHLTDETGLEANRPDTKAVIADGLLAVLAGSDTTVGALAAFFYYMMRYPAERARVIKEIDSVYPWGTDVTDTTKHSELTFTAACLHESLRLSPPIPTSGPREVSSGGRVINGHYLPDGTQIFVPSYAVHRNPDHFYPHPEDFVPSRWLENDHTESNGISSTLNRLAFIAFSYGPASCIGKNLAWRHMMTIIPAIMQNFDLEFADGFDAETWPKNIEDFFLTTPPPLMAKLTPRSSIAA